MRRRVLTILALLLAGAVVNVAVAWGCAVWIKPGAWPPYPKRRDFWEAAAPWFSDLLKTHRPPHFPDQLQPVNHELGPGVRYVTYVHVGLKCGEQHVGIVRIAGWPALSMQGSVWIAVEAGEVVRRWSLAIPPRKNRWIPLRPIWPGFAVNTLFYAALLWLLIPGSFALRRLIRRRRGLCPACGYDMTHAEHESCPECGAAYAGSP